MVESDGDTLFAWQTQDQTGEWGIIATSFPGIGEWVPLVSRSKAAVAVVMRPFAAKHQQATGQPVRLARFTLAVVECAL